MAKTELRIPEYQKKAFRLLLSYDDSTFGSLISSLHKLPLSASKQSSVKQVAQYAKIDENEASLILNVISNLFALRDEPGLSTAHLENEIILAAEADLDIKDNQRHRLEHFLREIFSLNDTLGVTSKARSVAHDSERTYCFSRTLTDLRPVFRPDSEDPSALVIVHNLKIAYHEGGDLREFFVLLTGGDLKRLLKVLQRAEKKELNLKPIAKGTSLPLMEVD